MTITAVQTSVTTAPAAGAPGMLYDSSAHNDVIQKVAEEDIPFGSFVKVDTDGCELPDSSGEVTGRGRGIALLDPSKPTTVGYKAGDIVSVLIKGRVWIQMEAGQSVAAYAVPMVRFTATDPEKKGAFRSDTDSGDAVAPTGCHMFSSASAGGLGVLQLGDMPDAIE